MLFVHNPSQEGRCGCEGRGPSLETPVPSTFFLLRQIIFAPPFLPLLGPKGLSSAHN